MHCGITSWITSLTIRAKRICSRNYLNQEINLIKYYAVWNCFPKRIANSIIKRALQTNDSNITRSEKDNTDSIKIFFNLNYSAETAGRMVKNASRSYIQVSNEKLMLSLSHTIKLQKFRSLQIQKIKHGV